MELAGAKGMMSRQDHTTPQSPLEHHSKLFILDNVVSQAPVLLKCFPVACFTANKTRCSDVALIVQPHIQSNPIEGYHRSTDMSLSSKRVGQVEVIGQYIG
jgi:hypothetical protein